MQPGSCSGLHEDTFPVFSFLQHFHLSPSPWKHNRIHAWAPSLP